MIKDLSKFKLIAFVVVCLNVFTFTLAEYEVQAQTFGDALPEELENNSDKNAAISRGAVFEGTIGNDAGYNMQTPPEHVNNGTSPILQGATSGTIGPPGADVDWSKEKKEKDNQANLRTLAIGTFFFLSIGACVISMFRRNNKNKNSIWVNSGIAVVVMIISGLVWGNFGWYY